MCPVVVYIACPRTVLLNVGNKGWGGVHTPEYYLVTLLYTRYVYQSVICVVYDDRHTVR